MPTKNTSELKAKILLTIRRRGPCLPVHIANETGLSMLFSSAFLSELIAEKKIQMSNMRVGSSPLYLIPGQENMLEKFSHHLKSKEKDAFFILKEKNFLEDLKQDPAIRVALRQIRDFAKPFKKGDKIIWRYFTIPETNFEERKKIKTQEISQEPLIKEKKDFPREFIEDIKKSFNKTDSKESIQEKTEKSLGIFGEKEVKKIPKRKTPIKKASQKKNEKFFNRVKEFLSKNSIDISDIKSFNKNELVLKIKDSDGEKLLFAFNKKRVSEIEITKSYKKALESNLKYIILSLSEPSKKLGNFIKAIKSLSKIEKLE